VTTGGGGTAVHGRQRSGTGPGEVGNAGPSMATMEGSVAGQLLVATPLLGDPNFERTVVFMVEHQEMGALGLVLNRPGHVDVSEILPAWSRLAAPPGVMFEGGPVQTDGVIALFRLTGTCAPPDGWRPVRDDIGIIDLESDADVVPDAAGGLRLFVGHAGWAPGQLDDELSLDAWWVVDLDPADVLSAEPGELWRTVLGRQPGRLSWMATYPDDPTLN
jgi:putative transcriptional regulator